MTSCWSSVIVVLSAIICSADFLLFRTEIKTHYFPENESLKIEFDTQKYNNTLYYMEVLKLRDPEDCLSSDDKPICKMNIKEEHPITRGIADCPLENGIYCVRVNPLTHDKNGTCGSGCRTEWRRFTVNDTDVRDCKNWSALITMGSTRNQNGNYTMQVDVVMDSNYMNCFKTLNITLWYGSYAVCDEKSGHEFNTLLAPVQGDLVVAFFENLQPGNYCVRMNARSRYCGGWCSTRYSSVKEIPDEEITIVLNPPSISFLPTWLYISGSIIFMLVIVVFIFHKMIKNLICQKPPPGAVPFLPVCTSGIPPSDLELVLLYSRDFNEHVEVVTCFYDFLVENCGFKKIHFDLKAESVIAVDLHSWVEKVTAYQKNRRFIIVESEGAVLQEEGRKQVKVVRQVNEDFLDTVFPYALQMLKGNISVNWDHNSVFVVKFKYSPENLKLKSFVPTRRYILPDHLFELYCDLRSLKCSNLKEEEEIRKKWDHFLDQKLIPLIDDTDDMLQEDPKLVNKSFLEEDLLAHVQIV